MNLNNEIMSKGSSIVESEITNKLNFYKYTTVISLIGSLSFCIMYNHEYEISKAKSSQLQQRDATIAEKNSEIKILEEFNINLSKNK